MKLFDTFTYFNETDLLLIRLNELKHLNPIHVLVEATTTHTGNPKPLYFEESKHLFSDYNIRHIIVDDLPNNGNPWDAENAQRNAISKGLYDAEDGDIVIISDLDEIPRWQAVQYYEPQMGTASIQMNQYSYYVNCLQGVQSWGVAKITTWGLLKKTTPNKLRNGGSQFSIYFGGWHMAWQGGLEKMFLKLDSFAHQEANNSTLRNSLEEKYETGQSLWGNDYWRFVDIDETFPKYLYEHQNEFKKLIKQI
jgi:beta-1,4-mannosyl-glycoprotein beta-1,4-N-acetylglucosaminyltransferase